MPYITKKRQRELRSRIDGRTVGHETTEGELNFILTTIIGEYIIKKGLRYKQINEVLGALQGCTLEFYRRVAVPYEESKIEENGDVDVYHIIEAMQKSEKA